MIKLWWYFLLQSCKPKIIDESNNNGLYQKKIIQDKWAILGSKMVHPHNSGLAIRIYLQFWRMKGANRYMDILLVIFREKIHLMQFDLFSL